MTRLPYTKASVHIRDFEPDRLWDAVRGARFEHFILDRAKCSVHLQRWASGDFSVDVGRYNFPVRAAGLFPSKKLCIGYMRSSNETTWVNGFEVGPKTLEYYPEASELNYRATAGGEWVAIEFSEEKIRQVARARLGREPDLPWKDITSFALSPWAHQELDALVCRLWDHPVSGTAMIEPILAKIAEMLAGFQNGASTREVPNLHQRQTVLRRANDHIRSRIGSPFNLEELARVAGATPRTLQREFSRAFGMTPIRWARCVALHRARNLLREASKQKFTVEAIAAQCGFHHMGRFSGYYRDLFGEFPSLTRRQPRPTRALTR